MVDMDIDIELMSLEYFDGIPIDKVLSKGKHSDGVYLLKNKIIKKVYNPYIVNHSEYFENEVKNLTYLKSINCAFVPQILAINKSTNTIYMTYCGLSIDILGAFIYDRYIDEINKKVDILKRYGMVLYNKVQDKYRMTINPKHICLLDNCIYFINFGSPLWSIKEFDNASQNPIIIDNYIAS
jgi:hypothetical protein